MATADLRAFTRAQRDLQARRAAALAALVAVYYRTQVDVEDPVAVERWLEIMLPRIMREERLLAQLAARYATEVRRLELPGIEPLKFDPSPGSVEEQIRASLMVVGPQSYLKKIRQIERREDIDEPQRQALIIEAKQVTAKKVAASAMRHVQSGGRQTIVDVPKQDRVAIGYVRVTAAKPCFFCAMLASRGLVFAEDSFDSSDARFTGDGTAKVHDSCSCGLKPVYTRQDPLVADTKVFDEMWRRWGAGGYGKAGALLRFRRGYEHWLKTGQYLDWEVVDDSASYYARNSAA